MLEFSLANLDALDGGKAALAFAMHVKRAALDCMDRPGDGTARSVTLKITMVPRMESDGDCNEVFSQLKVTSSLPPHQTKMLSLAMKRNGSLLFNPDSLDDVNQTTLLPEHGEDD